MKKSLLFGLLLCGTEVLASSPGYNAHESATASTWPASLSATMSAPALAPSRADGNAVELFGNVIHSQGSESPTTNAIYQFTSTAPEQWRGIKQGVSANGADTEADGKYWKTQGRLRLYFKVAAGGEDAVDELAEETLVAESRAHAFAHGVESPQVEDYLYDHGGVIARHCGPEATQRECRFQFQRLHQPIVALVGRILGHK